MRMLSAPASSKHGTATGVICPAALPRPLRSRLFPVSSSLKRSGNRPTRKSRVAEINRGDFAGGLRRKFVHARMEKRLQIDQDRMFTGRDEVVAVKVGRLEGVENRQVSALALIEAGDFVRASARMRTDEFGPAMIAAKDAVQSAKTGFGAAVFNQARSC